MELYAERAAKSGKRSANWRFAWDVIRLFRPSIIKPTEGTYRMNHYGLFKNHLKISIRSLRRNALFTSINVFGLAVSMSVGLLLVALYLELDSYDDFHESADKIYRVTSEYVSTDEEDRVASTSVYIGRQLQEQTPQIEDLTILTSIWRGCDFKFDEKQFFVEEIYAATPSFFDVFSFKVVDGSLHKALVEPYTVVLTETLSRKLFGDQNPIGKLVEIKGHEAFQSALVTAVVQDPGLSSHIRFEALYSMKTLELQKDVKEHGYMENPQSIWANYVYLKVNDHESVSSIEESMVDIMKDFNNSQDGMHITHKLQNLQDVVLSEGYGNEIGPTYRKATFQMMMGLAIVVMLLACFNYTNLSLARGLRRSKEVAIRKIQGAKSYQVFSQFTIEAVIVSLIALCLALIVFVWLKGGFINLPNDHAYGFQMITLDFTLPMVLWSVAFAVAIGCIAGLLPSFIMSRLNATRLFSDKNQKVVFSLAWVKNAMLTLQFGLSIGMIMFAFIVFRQFQFAVDYDLGYKTDDIIHINIYDDYAEKLEIVYAQIPEVLETSKSVQILGVGHGWVMTAVSEDKQDSMQFFMNYVDDKFLSLHDFELVEGTGFTSRQIEGQPCKEIVVNREFVKKMDLGDASDAVGKQIWYHGDKLKIVGIIDNMVNSSILNEDPMVPFGFLQANHQGAYLYLAVKVTGTNMHRVMEKLEQGYLEFDQVHPFEAITHNDRISDTYQSYKTTYMVVSFLAFLAITISALGLLGMMVFTTESRMKEISVRKVLGAQLSDLLVLFSKPIFIILVTAAILSIPTAWTLAEQHVLSDFAYRIQIGLPEVLSGIGIVFILICVTVIYQVRSASLQNPADLLRDE